MTIEEFDNTKFRSKMTVIYDGDRYTIKQINFKERLLGLGDDYTDDIYWARCESILLERPASLFDQLAAITKPTNI